MSASDLQIATLLNMSNGLFQQTLICSTSVQCFLCCFQSHKPLLFFFSFHYLVELLFCIADSNLKL